MQLEGPAATCYIPRSPRAPPLGLIDLISNFPAASPISYTTPYSPPWSMHPPSSATPAMFGMADSTPNSPSLPPAPRPPVLRLPEELDDCPSSYSAIELPPPVACAGCAPPLTNTLMLNDSCPTAPHASTRSKPALSLNLSDCTESIPYSAEQGHVSAAQRAARVAPFASPVRADPLPAPCARPPSHAHARPLRSNKAKGAHDGVHTLALSDVLEGLYEALKEPVDPRAPKHPGGTAARVA